MKVQGILPRSLFLRYRLKAQFLHTATPPSISMSTSTFTSLMGRHTQVFLVQSAQYYTITQHLHSSLLTQYSSMQSLASTYVVENKETKSCGLCVSCPFQHKPQCCIQDMGTRCTVCTFLPRCMSSRYATRSRSSESPARRDNE